MSLFAISILQTHGPEQGKSLRERFENEREGVYIGVIKSFEWSDVEEIGSANESVKGGGWNNYGIKFQG